MWGAEGAAGGGARATLLLRCGVLGLAGDVGLPLDAGLLGGVLVERL